MNSFKKLRDILKIIKFSRSKIAESKKDERLRGIKFTLNRKYSSRKNTSS